MNKPAVKMLPWLRKTQILLLALLTWITACSNSLPQSPESRIRNVLDQMEQAAENRSLSDFMRHISDSYQDHKGQTKADIQRLVQLQYLRNQKIFIYSSIQSLEITGQRAAVEVSAAMAASEANLESQSSGIRADTHQFSIVLKSSDEQQTWLVESVSWKRGWNDL